MLEFSWKNMKKPIFALAPMSNITDCAFRQIICELGKPNVLWTEFISCDGLISQGKENLLIDLKYARKQKPIIVQFFGKNPENFYKCAQFAQKLKFDGIDINMGCPDRAVIKQGAGSALILDPKKAKEIVIATKDGAGNLPVSVKTRLGFNQNIIQEWMENLLEMDLNAIILHGRIKKQVYSGKADWDSIKKAVEIAKKFSKSKRPVILGNGDIQNIEDAKQKIKFSGVDGAMVGRAVLSNPWFFSGKNPEQISRKTRIKILIKHIDFFEKFFKGKKPYYEIRKFFRSYISDFNNAKDLRIQLMKAESLEEMRKVLQLLDII